MSSNGLVTGFSMLNNVTAHAFLYFPGSGVSDLGALVPGGSSVGISVNSLGQVVGNSTGQDGRYRPFLYDSGTGMVDLNSLIGPETGWRLDSAVAINDAGMIAGTGNVGGETHAFLLTRGYTAPPDAPEPATTVMAGTAIVLIVAMQLRRTHRNRSRSARN